MMATLDWRGFLDLDEFERAAHDVWTPGARAMIQEGAGSNGAITANREAWTRWALRPRVLVDVSEIDTATTVLGQPVSLPVLVGPSGLHSMSHSEGEVATARGARAADTLMVLSAGTSRSMAEVRAAADGGPTWFQLYWGADRQRTASLTGMAEDAGCTALVITVDLPVRPILGHAMRDGVRAIGSEKPLYVLPRDAHLAGGVWDHDARLTWNDLTWLRSTTSLPIVLKGIMTGEDAALAVEHGVDAVIVSNHGGRSLDTPRGTLDALPEVVAAAGSQLEVYVDGGLRTGHDIVVALALGARATLIGRPVTWGLATGGAEGLGAVLEILRSQLRGVMGIIGAPTLADIVRAHVTERR
jgi:4-hydroxymandelate oxidase